mmetsp:Transcript_1507/g.1933  ORF Transcript_1507/g.1933 Transcript_1507/m.1933 type:complete len:321 (-) Transcript_1507:784-1746(-)
MEYRENAVSIRTFLSLSDLDGEVERKSDVEVETNETSTEVLNFGNEWVTESQQIFLYHNVNQTTRNDKTETVNEGMEDVITAKRVKRFEDEASRNWNTFYQRNTDRFFKDRHYLTKVFPELLARLTSTDRAKVSILEVGCGVANTVIPLLNRFLNCYATTVDFAPSAIKLLQENELYDNVRLRAFVCDVTIPGSIVWKGHDFATMIFVLSAITPEKMQATIQNVRNSLKPGGIILFRDYAQYDMAQLRFSKAQRLGYNLYVRQDGTRSFFFTLEGLDMLFTSCGMQRVHASYVRREVVNNKEGKTMKRMFVNACYINMEH